MENIELSLSDICFEHIKDTFYYGLFGDFKLVIDKATGYFNATKLCIEGGKEYKKWSRLEKSKKIVEYYKKLGARSGPQLYEVLLQNNDELNKQITGTYVPKELILDIASWVSIEFYDKCNKIIIDYFVQESQQKMEQLTLENKNLKEELEDTKEYTLILKEMMIKDDPITRTQVIYIATTELYAKTNNFKVGGVDDITKLKSRLSTYNTGRVKEDQFYYSDIFMVSNYHLIEAQLKNLLHRFRNKKEKEMYQLHYSDIKYIVNYLSQRDGEDVEEVNSKLTQFIANLNRRALRPIVPQPNTSYLTSITHLKEDGTVDNLTLQSNSFEEAVKEYILALSPTITCISKKKVFDDLKIKCGRINKYPILQAIFNQLRPEIRLVQKS